MTICVVSPPRLIYCLFIRYIRIEFDSGGSARNHFSWSNSSPVTVIRSLPTSYCSHKSRSNVLTKLRTRSCSVPIHSAPWLIKSPLGSEPSAVRPPTRPLTSTMITSRPTSVNSQVTVSPVRHAPTTQRCSPRRFGILVHTVRRPTPY